MPGLINLNPPPDRIYYGSVEADRLYAGSQLVWIKPEGGIDPSILAMYDTSNSQSYPGSGGTLFDLTANDYDLIATGSVTYSPEAGGVLLTANTDGYLSGPVSPAVNVSETTFLGWFRRNGLQANFAGLLGCRVPTANLMHFTRDHEIGYTWNNVTATWGWRSGLVVPDNTWFLVAVVVEPDKGTAYLNYGSGTLSAVNVVPNTPSSIGELVLARDPGGSGRFFNGAIAAGRLYNRAMSQSEFQAIYEAEKTRFGLT